MPEGIPYILNASPPLVVNGATATPAASRQNLSVQQVCRRPLGKPCLNNFLHTRNTCIARMTHRKCCTCTLHVPLTTCRTCIPAEARVTAAKMHARQIVSLAGNDSEALTSWRTAQATGFITAFTSSRSCNELKAVTGLLCMYMLSAQWADWECQWVTQCTLCSHCTVARRGAHWGQGHE